MSRTCVLLLPLLNKQIHSWVYKYIFQFNFYSYIRNPCSILKEYQRNFGHGFGLKKCSVYKLEMVHFLAKKKSTWSPPTFYIFTNDRLSVREMAGCPLTFFKIKSCLFDHLWAEQKVIQQQHIFHSKIITMFLVQPSQVSS